MKEGDKVLTVSYYTGNKKEREILAIKKNYIVLSVPEFKTKQARFYFRPTFGKYYNDYLHEFVKTEDK